MTEESANQLLRIPVRIFPYGPPHTDRLIRTASYGPTFHHITILMFLLKIKLSKRRKMSSNEAFINENVTPMMLNDLDLYYYSVQSYNKRSINRVCSCHTEKYRTLVFQHSPRRLGLYEDRGPVFLSTALAPG